MAAIGEAPVCAAFGPKTGKALLGSWYSVVHSAMLGLLIRPGFDVT